MKEFIENYIKLYRNKLNNSDNSKIKHKTPDIIEIPTQFEMLKLTYSNRILYIVIFHRDQQLSDLKDVILEVDYDIDNSENFVEMINKFISNNNLITDKLVLRPLKIREQLYPLVISEIINSQNKFYDFIQKKNIQDSSLIHHIWIFNGNLEKLDAEQEVSTDFMSSYFTTPEIMMPLLTSSIKKVESTFSTMYSSYIKPPVWLDNFPDYSILDDLRHIPLSKFASLIIDETIKIEEGGIDIKIRNNGFIQITNATKNTSLNFINLFIAFLVLQNYDIFYLPEHELFSQETKTNGNVSYNVIFSHSFRGEDRRYESNLRNKYYPSWLLSNVFVPIKPEHVKIAYEKAKKYLLLPEKYVIILFLTGFTYFRHSNYNQSFLNSWIVMENQLHRIFQEYLSENNISSDRKRKLRNYTIDQVIEILNILKKLDSDDYNLLKNLKKKRNNLIHRMNPISREEAFTCLSRSKKSILDHFFTEIN